MMINIMSTFLRYNAFIQEKQCRIRKRMKELHMGTECACILMADHWTRGEKKKKGVGGGIRYQDINRS